MTDQDFSNTSTLEPASGLAAPEVPAVPVDVVGEAIAVIDEALAKMMQRELVSSGEVADLLLDLRMVLTAR